MAGKQPEIGMRIGLLISTAAVLLIAGSFSAVAQQDPLQERLDNAVATYNKSVEQETESLANYIQGKIATAQGKGDLDLKKSFEAAHDSLQSGVLPTLQLLKGVVDQTKRDLMRAKTKLLSEYRDVERAYVKQGNDKRAEAVRTESHQLDRQLTEDVVAHTQRPRPKPVIPVDAKKWPKNGHHYVFVATPKPLSWSDAQRQCTEVGGYLACAESREESLFLDEVKAGKRAWLGSREVEGTWMWVSGVPSHRPNGVGGDKRYMATTHSGGRLALPDSPEFVEGYLCEWDE